MGYNGVSPRGVQSENGNEVKEGRDGRWKNEERREERRE